MRGDKILRSRVQSPDETTFYPFFCSILNYNRRGHRGRGGNGGGYTRAKPGLLLVLIISGLRLSVCVFLMDAQTVWRIVSKLGMVIEGHLAGNIGLVSCV